MKRVLVCEDEDTIREFVVINLKRAGYEVVDVDCELSGYVHSYSATVPSDCRLFLGETDTHSVHEHHIIIVNVIELINRQFLDDDKRIAVCLTYLAKRSSLIVDECDTGA